MSVNADCPSRCMYYAYCAEIGTSEAGKGFYDAQAASDSLTANFGSKCRAENPGDPAHCAIVGGAIVMRAVWQEQVETNQHITKEE